MAWIRETDYPNVADHIGYPAAVLREGGDAVAVAPSRAREVVGWRSACECGWRGETFYSRHRFHSRDGQAPDQVEGFDTRSATFAEWDQHLKQTLPELDVYDLAKQLGAAKKRFEEAVRVAEAAGVTRPRIAALVEMTGARIHFRRPDGLPVQDARATRRPAPQPPSPRRPAGPMPGRA